ncbi:hypothetical protein AB0J83_12585 [Actinoplanes sp. NPDC049596]|uniref:hypothetical protein n=1 Tax=unclassified Actinoplanes TaxID=2626549 RepID=UPI00341DE9B9
MTRSNPPKPSAGGGDDGGKDPPRRRTATGGADDHGNMAAAQDAAAKVAALGRPSGSTSRSSQPVKGPAAKIPLKPANNRHNLNSIRPKNPAKGKNTVVLPGTDVEGDLAEIAAGRGTWEPRTNRYEINGRTYAVEDTGTVIPVAGPGFVNLTRSAYKVLKQLIGSDGDVRSASEALRRDPAIGDADWRSALEVFRHHKSYRGEA